MSAETGIARRVLILTGRAGGGCHDAIAGALAERVRRRWPGSDVRVADVVDAMGPGVPTVLRAVSAASRDIRRAPVVAQSLSDRLWRHPLLVRASKATVSAWAGRRLAEEIENFGPDLILSSHPVASGGLDWLRRRRSLPVETYAWVTDFAPHPLSLYAGLDLTYLVHQAAVAIAEAAEPGIRVAVAAPPIDPRFHPGDGADARFRLGLEPDDRVVLVAGSRLGAVVQSARAALAAGPDIAVVIDCGADDHLRRRLAGEFGGRDSYRMRLLGPRDDLPEVTRAADLLITDGTGMTALEALQCDVGVTVFQPIAARDRASAELMVAAGVATLCWTPVELTRIIGELGRRDGSGRGSAAERYRVGSGPDGIQLLGGAGPARDAPASHPASDPRRSWPLRAQDAFFLYVHNSRVSQQVGTMIIAEPDSGAAPLTADLLRQRIRSALPHLPTLRRRPVQRGPLRRPGWLTDPSVDLDAHLVEHHAADDAELHRHVDRFWSEPVALETPPWQAVLIHRQDGASVLGFKFHHALGDAMSLIGALDRIVDPADGTGRGASRRGRGIDRTARRRTIDRGRLIGRVARGIWELAVHAAAPRTDFNHPLTDGRRGLLTIAVPSDRIRAISARYRCRSSEAMLAVIAQAIDRSGMAGGGSGTNSAESPNRIRTMVPVAMGLADRRRTGGNRTGVVSLDLPLGEADFGSRLAAVRRDLARRIDLGEPEAGAFVVGAIGMLPAPLHAVISRRIYNAAFFNLLTSYIPGPPRPRRLAGHTLTEVYPVLGLAEDVPLAIGILRYAGTTGISLLFDESVRAPVSDLAAAIDQVVAEQAAGAAETSAARPREPAVIMDVDRT